nr:Rieske 2Fe-2S domain-containing protein [Aureimonas endophytica]
MPIALSSDLPAASVMPIATPAGALALWRSASGRLTAAADRCPHRGMRLSHGFVRGEALSCIYHGWSYDASGRCVRIPAHPNLTPGQSICVATRAVDETGGIIWLAEERPEAPVPRLAGLSPVRSLTVDAPLPAVEAAAGAKADAVGHIARTDGAPGFLLAAQPDRRTLVHVLVAEAAGPAERVAASRAAEALRRAAEAIREEIAA